MIVINSVLLTSTLGFWDIFLLILYALVCVGIGIYSSRKQKDEDYLIAGRSMGLWGFITSVVASYIGGAAIVAYSAYVYQFGISAIAVFLGTSLGFVIFVYYAVRLRNISSDHQFHTLSDWFYYRIGKRVGLLSAIILFLVYFGMLLNQFIAGSSILSNISGWSYETSLLFSAAIITIYLVAGGFSSVIKTDIFQYIVLFVLFIFLAFILAGEKREIMIEVVDFKRMNIPMTIAFILFGIFIIFQSAEYWQRIYAARSIKVVKKGLYGAAGLTLISGFAITLIGIAAHHQLPDIEARNAFAEGLRILVPEHLISLGLVLIFAAIMSSADTQIFVLASSLAMDGFQKFAKTKPSQKQLRNRTRWYILMFSVLGFLFAYTFRDLVAVIIFITGIGFTIIPATIASFHWKIKSKAAEASFYGGIIYVLGLVVFAALQAEPYVFFKENADLAIGSVLVSLIILIIFQKFSRKGGA